MQGIKRILTAVSRVAVIGFCCASTSAFAVMSAPYGWYLEGNLGASHLWNRSINGDTNTPGLGANLNLGYKFMPYLGAEIGYTAYSNTIVRVNSQKVATNRFSSYDLAAKGILPIGDIGVEAFAKVGVSRLSSDLSRDVSDPSVGIGLVNSKQNATGLYLGGGVQYYFMPELAVVVQVMNAYGNSSTGNQYLFSGGLSFIFD